MSLGNAILTMLGHKDPAAQLLGAQLGAAGQPAGGVATPAGGTDTPGTSAPAIPPVAQAYQSPPDLMQLYTEMQNRQSQARNLDRGIGLIAASFAQPGNREMLMKHALGSEGGIGGQGGDDPAAQILQLVQAQQEQQIQQQQMTRAREIAAEFGISETGALYLAQSGKLDDVLIDRMKSPDTEVVERPDGAVFLINKRDGAVIENLGGPYQAPTTDIQNFEYGQTNEDFTPWLQETKRAGAHQVNIGQDGNPYGAPPTNHVWAMNSEGQIVMEEDPQNPGMMRPKALPVGPAAAEAQMLEDTAALSAEQIQARSAVVQDDIRRMMEIIGANPTFTTGLPAAVSQNLPFGLDALNADEVNLRRIADGVKANIGFDELRKMRESNPSGGALGQVSNTENILLQSVLGSIDNVQSAEELLYTLNRLTYVIDDYLAPAEGRDTGRPRLGAVVDGWQYIGGDPNDERSWRVPR